MKHLLLFVGLLTCGISAAKDYQENRVPAIGQNAKNVVTFDATKKGPRVLYVGNSITLHGPRPSISWTNNWGMAATALEKDYVHLLSAKIAAAQPEAQCCLLQVADTFERSFYKPVWELEKNFKWAREFHPDVIILFFGANVPWEYDIKTLSPAPSRTFAAAMEEFINYIDPDKKATIFISEGFYARTALDAEKATLAKKRGFNLIKLTDIRSIDEVHGLYNHPNDIGMALIAERFWSAISPRIKAN